MEKQLSQDVFTSFFKINYTFEGGDIKQTESLLNKMMKHISQKDIIVPLSGGVDSTLLNCLIDKHRTEKYPAYFIVNNQKVYITLSRRILFSRKNNKFDI